MYSDFTCAWENLEEKHDVYICTLSDDQTDTNEGWFDNVRNTFNDTRDLYLKYKNDVGLENEISKALQYRGICENNFNELCDNIENSIAHKFQNETVIRERDLLLKLFDDIQSAHK